MKLFNIDGMCTFCFTATILKIKFMAINVTKIHDYTSIDDVYTAIN